jgi:hypothetical protein
MNIASADDRQFLHITGAHSMESDIQRVVGVEVWKLAIPEEYSDFGSVRLRCFQLHFREHSEELASLSYG